MKRFLIQLLIYFSGIAINLIIINNYYKVNSAYSSDGKDFLKAMCLTSYAATPGIIFVCWDSHREWYNK